MQFRLTKDGILTIDCRPRYIREAVAMMIQGMFSWSPPDHPIKQPGAGKLATDLMEALDTGAFRDIANWPKQ